MNTVGMGPRRNLSARRAAALLASYGIWMVILVIAFFLQVVPVLLVVAMFTLAVGLSVGVEFVAIPLVVLVMVLAACLIASRNRARHGRRSQDFARVRLRHGPGVPEFPTDRSAYFRDFRRVR